MLKKLELGNFKAFGDIQSIELKPLTLFFGANSAGKSTVLQSLIYLSQAFKNQDWNIHTTEQGGEFIDFGGLKNLVHQKDADRTIHFGLTISGYNIIAPFHLLDDDAFDIKHFESDKFKGFLKGRGKISPSSLDTPYYNCTYTFRFGLKPGQHIFQYFSITEDEAQLINPQKSNSMMKRVDAEGEVLSLRIRDDYTYQIDNLKVFSKFFTKSIAFDEQVFKKLLEDVITPDVQQQIEQDLLEQCKYQATSDDDQFFAFWLSDESEEIERYFFEIINKELNDINAFLGDNLNVDGVKYPIENELDLYKYLHSIEYLGYFREVPPRVVTETQKIFDSDSYHNVWQKLLVDEETLQLVNNLLSNPKKLGMGYRLVKQEWKNSETDNSFNTLEIHDIKKDAIVNLREIGQGVIQIIPIAAKLYNYSECLIACEQPELHLHPGMQSRLGTIFCDEINKHNEDINRFFIKRKQLMLETHSEHIIKAIQLYVAQQKGVTADDINIVYIQQDEAKEQSTIRQIKLDHTGSFTEPWPDDFFDTSSDLTIERLKAIVGRSN
ncbi:MAG: DUF3696 domain-containing protein [Balneolales bacterium]